SNQENEKKISAPEPTGETNAVSETDKGNEEKNTAEAQTAENPEAISGKTVEDPAENTASETISEEKEINEPTEVEDEEEVASSEDGEEDDGHNEEKAQKDYSKLSEKELVAELEKLLKGSKIQNIKHDVEEIRSEFNHKFNEELEQKKEEFLAGGGNIIDFHYTTPLKKEFNSLYFDFKEKRNTYYKNLKKDLQANLDKRWELIEELKGLLSAEENINTTYKHFKEIQEKWHVAGAIPRDKYNTVWNT